MLELHLIARGDSTDHIDPLGIDAINPHMFVDQLEDGVSEVGPRQR